jgi:hypothetical protein
MEEKERFHRWRLKEEDLRDLDAAKAQAAAPPSAEKRQFFDSAGVRLMTSSSTDSASPT